MFMSTCVCVCSTLTRAIAPCIIKTNELKGGSLMKDGIVPALWLEGSVCGIQCGIL